MSRTFRFERFDINPNDGNDRIPAADGAYVYAEDAINREAVLQAQIRTLETQLADTKRAALAGMDAVKSASSIQLQEAQRLRAESAPEVLASERAANAILTDENERLRAAQPFCVDCGDSIMAHDPGTCGTCHSIKYASGAPEPEWIVNDLGELGVRVGARFFFLYKGDNHEYGEHGDVRDGVALHEDGSPMQYRIVGKREFGEACWPEAWIRSGHSEARYTANLVYRPGLSFGKPEDGDWKPLPAAPQ